MSFPQKRESRISAINLDPRLRGDDIRKPHLSNYGVFGLKKNCFSAIVKAAIHK